MAGKVLTAKERTIPMFDLGPEQRRREKTAELFGSGIFHVVLVAEGSLGRGHLARVEDLKAYNVAYAKWLDARDKWVKQADRAKKAGKEAPEEPEEPTLETLCEDDLFQPDQVVIGRGICQTCAVTDIGKRSKIIRIRKGAK